MVARAQPEDIRRWREKFQTISAALARMESGAVRRAAADIMRKAAQKLRKLVPTKAESHLLTFASMLDRRADGLCDEEVLIPIRDDFVDLQYELDRWSIEPKDWSQIRILMSRYTSPEQHVDRQSRHLKVKLRSSGGRPADYPRHAAVLIAAEIWQTQHGTPPRPVGPFVDFCQEVFDDLDLPVEATQGLEDLVTRILVP